MAIGGSKLERLERVQVESRTQLREWLDTHHTTSEGIWLVTFKKAEGDRHVCYDDIVEELLCFGWVDSLPRSLDGQRSMLLCTPRKARSGWSKINKDRVAKLQSAGLMEKAGLRAIETAKRNGTWTKLDEASALVVPSDLEAAFREFPGAKEKFEGFPPGVRRGILEWIAGAKRAPTRAKRVQETASLAAQNIRANQWPRPKR